MIYLNTQENQSWLGYLSFIVGLIQTKYITVGQNIFRTKISKLIVKSEVLKVGKNYILKFTSQEEI